MIPSEHLIIYKPISATNLPNLDEQSVISKELNVPLIEVNNYFRRYEKNYKHPIRDLTSDEILFANILISNHDYSYYSENNITEEELENDPFILARDKAGFDAASYHYKMFRRYEDILLLPYLEYKNKRKPALTIVTEEDILLALSSIIQSRLSAAKDVISSSKIILTYFKEMQQSQQTNSQSAIDYIESLGAEQLKNLVLEIEQKEK